MAARRPRFAPYRPPVPPAGTYDPALDAQQAAAQRGLFDLGQDVETAGTRAQNDFGLAQTEINRNRGWNLEDLTRSRDRSLTDLQTSAARGGQDYQRNIEMLTRRYGILDRNQLQQRNVAGVIRGGAALQAAAKRAENQALDRQPLDTSYQRFTADNAQSQARVGEDFASQSARVNQGADWNIGQAGLGLERGNIDRTQQLSRANRENQAFGLDIAAQRAYQAAGAGWDPGPAPPASNRRFARRPFQPSWRYL